MMSVAAQHSVGHLQQGSANRIANFGWLSRPFHIEHFGPIIVGILIDRVGYRSAFAALAASSLISLGLVLGIARRALDMDKPGPGMPSDFGRSSRPCGALYRRVLLAISGTCSLS
jgi:hypothetical protein